MAIYRLNSTAAVTINPDGKYLSFWDTFTAEEIHNPHIALVQSLVSHLQGRTLLCPCWNIVPSLVIQMVKDGRKIWAVKLYRSASGLHSIIAAKNRVDAIIDDYTQLLTEQEA